MDTIRLYRIFSIFMVTVICYIISSIEQFISIGVNIVR